MLRISAGWRCPLQQGNDASHLVLTCEKRELWNAKLCDINWQKCFLSEQVSDFDSNIQFDQRDQTGWILRLQSVTIPESVTFIDTAAFNRCRKLISVTIPNSVDYIGDYAFSICSKLISIVIPNSVTRIDYCAFKFCGALASVSIPKSVTFIDDNAFDDCSSLASVEIPRGLEYSSTAFPEDTRITLVWRIPSVFELFTFYWFCLTFEWDCDRLVRLTYRTFQPISGCIEPHFREMNYSQITFIRSQSYGQCCAV